MLAGLLLWVREERSERGRSGSARHSPRAPEVDFPPESPGTGTGIFQKGGRGLGETSTGTGTGPPPPSTIPQTATTDTPALVPTGPDKTALVSPANPLRFFRQSRTLRALGVLKFWRHLPLTVYSIEDVYRRWRFPGGGGTTWTGADDAFMHRSWLVVMFCYGVLSGSINMLRAGSRAAELVGRVVLC